MVKNRQMMSEPPPIRTIRPENFKPNPVLSSVPMIIPAQAQADEIVTILFDDF